MQDNSPACALYVGLMSGTSADGIDAALVQITDQGRCRFIAGITHAWQPALREQLIALGQGAEPSGLDALGLLDARIGLAFASATNTLLEQARVSPTQVTAIGSHGQTVRHRPSAEVPFTVQLGDPSRIAEHTGITTVADFRRRDVAAGGQGAPLMPAFHLAMLGNAEHDRAVLNLGGIANLTLINRTGCTSGFDTGPANALCDAWCLRHTGKAYDANGQLAAQGQVDKALLQALLSEPWFSAPPPKSTGREQFHLAWVDHHLQGRSSTVADVQATLLELTAITVAQALLRSQPTTAEVLVCGGGTHNPVLMARLRAHLPGMSVQSIAGYGLDPDHVEAMGFAWLAWRVLNRLPGNLPAVTGAAGPRLLGAIYPA